MAAADWTFIADATSSASIKRGVTAGMTPPNGGGTFVYGFASQDNIPGTVALYTNLAGFAPATKGADVRAAMKRGISGEDTLFAPYIFAALQATTSADKAYILGLSDSNPAHIELRKGTLASGLPDAAPGASGVLARSSITIAPDTWVQLRLEVVNNTNGDVVLNCYQNDLGANAVGSPIWTAIPGLAQFIDDALGVNSGSAPLAGGRMGFGFVSSDVSRRAYFDELVTIYQN